MTDDIIFNHETEQNRRISVEFVEDDDEDHSISLTSKCSIDDQPMDKVGGLDDKKLNSLYDNWLELDAELRTFELKHKEYVRKLDEVELLKTKYKNEFDKYKKRIFTLQKDVAQLQKSYAKKG
ncbi:unnamed protein product [Rotaria sp. Silwood2]|nr:unnamed protein product [Rotaria sp. Silwood2]CAF4588656.1 unnamed protein product [Rotaria sp. Silwood2]